jgi:hypothetical protein
MRDIPFAHLSSPKIHLKKQTWKKKQEYKGHQTNANMNVAHLVRPYKFQRDGVAKVSKFFPVDLETTNTSNPNMSRIPSI